MSGRFWAKAPGYKRKKRIGGRGTHNRRVLNEETVGGVETYLHATKGFRSRREPEIGNNAAGDLFRSFIG